MTSHAPIEQALVAAKALESGLADLAAALMADDRTSDGLMRDFVLARYSAGFARQSLARLLARLDDAVPPEAKHVRATLATATEQAEFAKGSLTNADRALAATGAQGEAWRAVQAGSAALVQSLTAADVRFGHANA